MTSGLGDAEMCLQKMQRVVKRFTFIAALVLSISGCAKKSTPVTPAPTSQVSRVQAASTASGVVINTPAAEFVISATGYVAAKLVADNKEISLDDAGNYPGIEVTAAGKQLPDVTFDVLHPQISDPHGRLGTRG